MASLEKYELMETELTAISTADSELSMRYYYSRHLAWQMEPTTEVFYILDKQINKMFLLEDSSKDIWLSFSKQRTYNQVLLSLSEIYGCDISEIKSLVDEFVLELLENGLIYEL